MSHRLISILISLGIIAAVVGGVVSWEWKQISPKQTKIATSSSPTGPSTTPRSATSSALVFPVPVLGPDSVEAVDGTASATPTIIAVNESTDVTVTIKITDSRLIKGSVNLQRVDAAGKVMAILGTLNDSGTNGDAIAGDNTYSIRKSFTEATATPVRLLVSWALRGVLKRSVSNTVIVSVISLPPDPGESGKATLGGIDSDGDGTRDDVQRYIALTYATSEKSRRALTQVAKALQQALQDAPDQPKTLATAEARLKALRCLSYVRGVRGASAAFDDLRAIVLNTRGRTEAYLLADQQLGGRTFSAPPISERKVQCEFDPDLLRD